MLDRNLQLEILEVAKSAYPSHLPITYDIPLFSNKTHEQLNIIAANIRYLGSHGLINRDAILIGSDLTYSFTNLEITHVGLDFLANDGGLSEILNVVTIKFEEKQLKLLLESKIQASNLTLEEKNRLIETLRDLPSNALTHLTTKIIDTGYDNLSSLMSIIQNNIPF